MSQTESIAFAFTTKAASVTVRKEDVPTPLQPSDEHVFEVKLAVLVPADSNPDTVNEMAILALLRNGFKVVAGFNGMVQNVTSKSGGLPRPGGPRIVCTGFTNRRITKSMRAIPVFVPEVEVKDGAA